MDATGAFTANNADASIIFDDGLSIGETLRMARQRAGLSQEQIASTTRISLPYIEAIETMDRAALPGRAYALGFVRCYAQHLGLDAIDAVRRFKAEGGNTSTPLSDLTPKPAPAWVDFRLPRGTGLVLVIVAALSLATWYGLRMPAQTSLVVPPVPEGLAGWAKSADLKNVPQLRSVDARSILDTGS